MTRVEDQVRRPHTASSEIGDLLNKLAEQSRAASIAQPIGRQRSDVTVRLLNQTLTGLRKLPELMEDMTESV
ncbi:hypothetical protein [Streptomyces sp. NPDC097610]|uniref:hypothetical protein n=1 Tax=Streptomyces sp. NPDC097610 TaxID=3157227 RepID=UPI003316D0AB